MRNLREFSSSFLAFDLGAASGRAVHGLLDMESNRLRIQELHRFKNRMLTDRGHLHWNVHRLFDEIQTGLSACAQETRIEGLGVDTWGVDFGLLAKDGTILGMPFAYRDSHTQGAMEEFFTKIPKERIYRLTGVQFLPFNSLFQLYAMKRDSSSLLESARDILFMPDLFHYLLTGEKKSEFSFASTTQLFNPQKRAWENELLHSLGLSPSLLQDIVEPGTVIGNLDRRIAHRHGWGKVPVIAVATHDTGSAVAAVPATGDDWAYISSGTWSLMGIETKKPIINDLALKLNFSNEGGVEGTVRFLKNITGLWLLQRCQDIWFKKKQHSYDNLIAMALEADPFRFVIDPDWEGFLRPDDMLDTIQRYCIQTGQVAPQSYGEFVRGICESLALKYRLVLDELRKFCSHPIRRIHIIGGGAKNQLLCQFTANATGLPVYAGPSEATAIGNLMVQSIACGLVSSLESMREIIRNSFEVTSYEPERTEDWEEALELFRRICKTELKDGQNPER
jgi:rhamnulokinase